MQTVKELKKALKKAQSEIDEKKRIENLADSLSKEDIQLLKKSEDEWGAGHLETVRFTLEIDMDIIASPENNFDKANLHHAKMRLVSANGIPIVLAREIVSSLEYMQHDDSDFSWASGLPVSKTVTKAAQVKVDSHRDFLKTIAKKYGVDSSTLNEALYLIRNRPQKKK